jgi:hypothetical protein
MSANIYYRPKKSRIGVPSSAAPSFIDALTDAFGVFPTSLTRRDEPVLRGMRAGRDEGMKATIDALLDGLEKFDEIEVFAEY